MVPDVTFAEPFNFIDESRMTIHRIYVAHLATISNRVRLGLLKDELINACPRRRRKLIGHVNSDKRWELSHSHMESIQAPLVIIDTPLTVILHHGAH